MDNEMDIVYLTQVIKDEIALEGLEGCLIKNFIDLFKPLKSDLHIDLNNKLYHEFLWRLLVNQNEINFYQIIKSSTKKDKQVVVNKNNVRGFSSNYENRTCANGLIRNEDFDPSDTYENIIKKYGTTIVIVADQNLRNNVLCPSHKDLKYESITDLEYCVLESIGKSRKRGVYTSGDGSLSHLFDIGPKQLHYILNILEMHEFVAKQAVSAQKQRCIIYLTKYEQSNETNIEKLTRFLANKKLYQERVNEIQIKLSFSAKKIKNLIAIGEKQNIVERFLVSVDVDDDECGVNRKKSKNRQKIVRMLRLTESYVKKNGKLLNKNVIGHENGEEEEDGDDDEDEAITDVSGDIVGSLQLVDTPMYTQLFQYIERCGQNGTSLKRLGLLFGLDFYKARRIGSHLQTHPEIVTVVKETDHGRAKYQIIKLRKFLEKSKQNTQLAQQFKTKADLSIHNLVTERAVNRKKIILDYMEQRKLCTKFEIDREIRRLEQLEGQKGQIDSKTSKRILAQLEEEKKICLFSVSLRSTQYQAVRLAHISETDELYQNYIHTFARTVDFCANQKTKSTPPLEESKETEKEEAGEQQQREATLNAKRVNSLTAHMAPTPQQQQQQVTQQFADEQFKLTRVYIQSIVEKLEFSYSFAKIYGLVSKMQKSIVLHRFIHYILYFYDGTEIKNYDFDNFLNDTHVKPPTVQASATSSQRGPGAQTTIKDFFSVKKSVIPKDEVRADIEYETLTHTEPSMCYHQKLSWKTFIPPIRGARHLPQNCLFVSDLVSNMPLSIFTSICANNHKIPGLLSLLKHPYKRHMLIKDLPPHMIAPLIHERRYLQRLLTNLQILSCLGLISFVDNPNKDQGMIRNIQSQLVYVHRSAVFRDTSKNAFKKWEDIVNFDLYKFDKLSFKFDKFDGLMDYWKKLLYVSLNTYKFNVTPSLKENKQLRAGLHRVACKQVSVGVIEDPKPLKGDHLGPGGYDSQLFLNVYTNWVLPTPANVNRTSTNEDIIPCIEYNPKQPLECVYSELAMPLPYGIYRGGNGGMSRRRTKRAACDDEDDSEGGESDLENEWEKLKSKPKKKKKPNQASEAVRMAQQKKIVRLKPKVTTAANFKIKYSKHLLNKAKMLLIGRHKPVEQTTTVLTQVKAKPKPMGQPHDIQRRSIWSRDEDDKILLIKVASLYFLPNEKVIQFKIIRDVFYAVFKNKSKYENKNEKAFGRRMKCLLKSRVNRLSVSNKLESCKHNLYLHENYSKIKLKRSSNLDEQIKVFTAFLNDMEKYVTDSSAQMDLDLDFEMPSSVQELYERYHVQSQKDVFRVEPHFKQPTNEFEIVKNTLHSAIHSTILINDKNPRDYESSKLFNQYSDHLLTEVITTMTRRHNIIAPTKCSEIKKKKVTQVSKHVGKAYHISQRYQYKWVNNVPMALFNDVKKFKEQVNRKSEIDCTDLDDAGMACYLAHNFDNSNLDIKVDVPNKIWVSKLL